MGMEWFLVSIIIAICICIVSHLTVDKDFPEEVKSKTLIIAAICSLIYIIFGIF